MEPLQPERIHRGLGEAAETGEGEIEVHRPISQAETGQVERHRPEATSRQLLTLRRTNEGTGLCAATRASVAIIGSFDSEPLAATAIS